MKSSRKDKKMSATSIGFSTKAVVGRGRKDGGASLWTGQILATRSVDESEFCAAVAQRTRQSAAEVSYMLSTAADVLRDFLRQGCHVNLSDVGFGLALTGTFPSVDAAPDAKRNEVRVCAHAKRALAKSISLAELNLVNTSTPLAARIFSVMDVTLQRDGVIADPSRVLITGEGLRVDQAADDEGVWIVDAAGERISAGTIIENDAATLDCSFAELPPAGAYRIEVRARNGAAASFAPATVRKPVEVK